MQDDMTNNKNNANETQFDVKDEELEAVSGGYYYKSGGKVTNFTCKNHNCGHRFSMKTNNPERVQCPKCGSDTNWTYKNFHK